jgi:hypothetical protein
MWDTATEHEQHDTAQRQAISHDRPCQECGHALHTFLPCSDDCGCRPQLLPGVLGSLSPAV